MDEPGWIIQAAVGQGLTVAKLSVDTEESLRGGESTLFVPPFYFCALQVHAGVEIKPRGREGGNE